MSNLPRMDISMPVAPVLQVADVRPRVETVQGVSPVTEQVGASPQAATADAQTKGSGTGTGMATTANPQAAPIPAPAPAPVPSPVASNGPARAATSHVSYFDNDAQTIVRQMVDEKTGKVVQSYPDQAELARIARIREELGKMVDKKL